MVAGVDELDRVLREHASVERAVREKAYLRSELVHYGIRVPDVRAAVRQLLRANPDLDHDRLNEMVRQLWDSPADRPVHERRLAAAQLLTARTDLLRLEDAELWERLIRQSRTWALVDVLAGDAIGPAIDRLAHSPGPVSADGSNGVDVLADPGRLLLDRWAVDQDFWLRRSALLVHLRPLGAGGGDWERFTRYADAMLDEREFFIRKAIGWVLRATSRRRPDLVYAWILPRAERASGVTLREAIKYLSAEQVTTIQTRR
ncbi:MAG TPA: DNA alkylation repair protein [Kineosporiaceae bacterium]|nr:DNA alkylation repair protein [Kineosporiaceae bacterium]